MLGRSKKTGSTLNRVSRSVRERTHFAWIGKFRSFLKHIWHVPFLWLLTWCLYWTIIDNRTSTFASNVCNFSGVVIASAILLLKTSVGPTIRCCAVFMGVKIKSTFVGGVFLIGIYARKIFESKIIQMREIGSWSKRSLIPSAIDPFLGRQLFSNFVIKLETEAKAGVQLRTAVPEPSSANEPKPVVSPEKNDPLELEGAQAFSSSEPQRTGMASLEASECNRPVSNIEDCLVCPKLVECTRRNKMQGNF